MTVSQLTDDFKRLESKIARQKGSFALFALFLRDDAPDRWDLIASAPWFGNDRSSTLNYFVSEIKANLGPGALTNLARIVLLDPQDVAVQNLNRTIQVEHGNTEVRDSSFFWSPRQAGMDHHF